MKKRKTPDLEKYLEGKKRRFVNYTQGPKIYKMSYWPFVRLAKKAEAGCFQDMTFTWSPTVWRPPSVTG